MDRQGPITEVASKPMDADLSMPWTVRQCANLLDTGVRAINALLTVGRGQRIGCLQGPVSVKVCCWE